MISTQPVLNNFTGAATTLMGKNRILKLILFKQPVDNGYRWLLLISARFWYSRLEEGEKCLHKSFKGATKDLLRRIAAQAWL